MISFWRIFWLEWTSLVRSGTLAMLALASIVWMVAAPHIFSGDGTVEGARELSLHYSLGGVTALAAIALLMSAAGTLASDRVAKRLALTQVRPVRLGLVALGRTAALVACGATVLALAASVEYVRQKDPPPCRHVLRPILPSPREEAELAYREYMADPRTPESVRLAKKSVVLRLLAQRALDHYLSVPTGGTVRLAFPASLVGVPERLSARLRFTNAYEMRDEVCGTVSLGDWRGGVSNLTQAVVEIPLTRGGSAVEAEGESSGRVEWCFTNMGGKPVMLRPRRDIEILVPADGFGWNLCRAVIEMLAVLSMLISFGVFLGAGLGRPVALFVAIVTLTLSEMSPSVVEQYPDELETDRLDSVGLYLTRFAAMVTHPVSALSPAASLGADECIERRELLRDAVVGFLAFPLACSLLAAFVLPRKQEGED